MKKIFTLIAVAAMTLTVNAQGIVWAFNESPTAAPAISDENIASGSVTFTGTDANYEGAGFKIQTPSAGDNSGIPFVTVAPAEAETPIVVEWKAEAATGKTFSPSKIIMRMARFGTDAGLVNLSYKVDGGEAVVLAEGLHPARNNKTQAEDKHGADELYCAKYSKNLQNVSVTKDFILIASVSGLATNKQGGFAEIIIQTGSETPTGIQTVKSKTIDVNAPVYNLAGQQVDKSFKGVVIQNGVKRIQK